MDVGGTSAWALTYCKEGRFISFDVVTWQAAGSPPPACACLPRAHAHVGRSWMHPCTRLSLPPHTSWPSVSTRCFAPPSPSGVEYLYVHVVADNSPALELYRNVCGFEVEAQEAEGYARALQRPRRMLLVKQL